MIGCAVALYLRQHFGRVALVERETDVLQRASLVNQARVHNGYHYPRSLLTGIRSRVNFPLFVERYEDCIEQDFEKVYAIARRFSKVTADQFVAFCRRIGAPIAPAPGRVRKLFDSRLVENAFIVREYAFDAIKLATRLRRELLESGVDLLLATDAWSIVPDATGHMRLECESRGSEDARDAFALAAKHVFNCTYSRLNELLRSSDLPLLSLKHEWTEMALIAAPEPLERLGITVMCGPFFSMMPYPSRGIHTLSHVRYTPHFSWQEPETCLPGDGRFSARASNFERIIRDARRYLPLVGSSTYVESLWETKTILPSSEVDDSRPILFKRHHGLPNLTCIMGGKIDNIFDVLAELEHIRRCGELA